MLNFEVIHLSDGFYFRVIQSYILLFFLQIVVQERNVDITFSDLLFTCVSHEAQTKLKSLLCAFIVLGLEILS